MNEFDMYTGIQYNTFLWKLVDDAQNMKGVIIIIIIIIIIINQIPPKIRQKP